TSSVGWAFLPSFCWGEAYIGVLAQRISDGVEQVTPETVASRASSRACRACVSLMPKSVILRVPLLTTGAATAKAAATQPKNSTIGHLMEVPGGGSAYRVVRST